MNNVKVFALLAGLTALFMMIGQAIGGASGMWIALLLAAGMNFFMYWGSASMVLRAYRARVVTAAEAPELYAMVDRLRQRAGRAASCRSRRWGSGSRRRRRGRRRGARCW